MSYLQVSVCDWDEESSSDPRWSLTLTDDRHPHHPHICHLSLEWSTRTDGKWGRRSALQREIRIPMPPGEIQNLIETLRSLPTSFPTECLGHDHVHSHGGHSPTKANSDSMVCRSISVSSDSGWKPEIYIRKESPIWTDSEAGTTVMRIVSPYITTIPLNRNPEPKFLP